MPLDTMPAEVRQRIIEHLLPEVVDDVMHVCPCLANDELFHTLSCDCFDFAHWSGGVFTDQTSQIVRLCRPTLFVHRQLHDDTITIMLKLPSTIICCSGACLLAFLSYTPLRYCKSIMRCTIKFSMAKFVSHWRSTNNWSITNDWGITKRNEAFFEYGVYILCIRKQLDCLLRVQYLFTSLWAWLPAPVAYHHDDYDEVEAMVVPGIQETCAGGIQCWRAAAQFDRDIRSRAEEVRYAPLLPDDELVYDMQGCEDCCQEEKCGFRAIHTLYSEA